MIPAVVSSLIYIRARKAMEIFSPTMRKLWKDWELRILVLLSLALQIILIIFGKRRKYMKEVWIRFLLWSAYLMADWVATVALGVLLNNMGDVYEKGGKAAKLDADTQLSAFWAPFLLLHLGGPDTITAYSLEDNELWLRHFLGLGVQTGVAIYIFLLAWTASRFSILTMPMLLAGIIKYGERTWALRSASSEHLRDSMLTAPDPGPNYSKFMEEFTLKQYEGFHAVAEEVLESQGQVDVSSKEGDTTQDAPELRKAEYLFKTFKRLFVDLILSFQDRDDSQSQFTNISCKSAFRVIEIELGFMYDMLYTKGKIIYSRNGCYLRCITLVSTCIALVFFSLHKTHGCAPIDIAITFLLLAIAIFLELYAILLLLSSDWTDLYLSKHEGFLRQVITHLQLPKRRRWSKSLAQYNLLNYSLKYKPVVDSKIQKLFSIDDIIQHLHMTTKEVEDDLENFIFEHLKKKFQNLKAQPDDDLYAKELKDLCMCRGARALRGLNSEEELRWSVEVEFDQSIIIWHIATEICYQSDAEAQIATEICYQSDAEAQNRSLCKISNSLSNYMMYLLVMRPAMLPMGIGTIRYQDTCAEAIKFFQKHESISGTDQRSQNICSWVLNMFKKRNSMPETQKACDILLKVNTVIAPVKVKGDRSKSVLFDACRLASQLENMQGNKWEVMANVWVEMLAYAASHCRGTYHAQQLGRGGELLTHVWLLMAHFGLTEQFQISHGHARAKLVVH